MNKDAEPDYKPVTAMTIAEINKRNQELYKNASANSEGVQATRDDDDASKSEIEKEALRYTFTGNSAMSSASHPDHEAFISAYTNVSALSDSERRRRAQSLGIQPVILKKEELPKGQDENQQDTDFFEGPEGYVHPIRGTKGYSNRKAGK